MAAQPSEPGPEVESLSFDEILDEYRYHVPEVPSTPRQLFFFARKQGYEVRYKPMKAYFQFPLPEERIRPVSELKPLEDSNFEPMLAEFETRYNRPPADPSEVLRFVHEQGYEPSFSVVLKIFQDFGQAVPKRIEQRYKKPIPNRPLPPTKKKRRPGDGSHSPSSPAPSKPLPLGGKSPGGGMYGAGSSQTYGGFLGLANNQSGGQVLNTGGTATFTFSFTPYTESGAVIAAPPTDVELVKEMALDAGNGYLDEVGDKPANASALFGYATAEGYDLTLEEIELVFNEIVEEIRPKLERTFSDQEPLATRRVSYASEEPPAPDARPEPPSLIIEESESDED